MKVLRFVLAIIIFLVGVYQLYTGLARSDKKADEIAQTTAVSIGETAADKDGVSFSVSSIENTNSIGEGLLEITTENNFVVVNIKITNNSTEPYDVNTLRFLLNDGERDYEYCEDALFSIEEMMYMDTLNPGLSKDYVIVYETPHNTIERDWRMKILANAYSDKDIVYINLN